MGRTDSGRRSRRTQRPPLWRVHEVGSSVPLSRNTEAEVAGSTRLALEPLKRQESVWELPGIGTTSSGCSIWVIPSNPGGQIHDPSHLVPCHASHVIRCCTRHC